MSSTLSLFFLDLRLNYQLGTFLHFRIKTLSLVCITDLFSTILLGNSLNIANVLLYFFTMCGGYICHSISVEVRGQPQDSILSFYYVDSKDCTQVIGLGIKHLYPQSSLSLSYDLNIHSIVAVIQ